MQHLHAAKISILGDSISTLNGYSPIDGCYYHTAFASSTGISSAADTWWGKVIAGLSGSLLRNNSYAGSTVCRNGYQPASSPWRIAKLRDGALLPDYVFIFSGLNDVAFFRTPQEFGSDYAAMLDELQKAYPDAKLCCATLCEGMRANPEIPLFLNLRDCRPLEEYNAEIRAAVQDAAAVLVDLAAFEQPYFSLDGAHPNAAGMEQLAQMWLRCLLPSF